VRKYSYRSWGVGSVGSGGGGGGGGSGFSVPDMYEKKSTLCHAPSTRVDTRDVDSQSRDMFSALQAFVYPFRRASRNLFRTLDGAVARSHMDLSAWPISA